MRTLLLMRMSDAGLNTLQNISQRPPSRARRDAFVCSYYDSQSCRIHTQFNKSDSKLVEALD
jgi:hypothetical protein